MTDTSVPSRLDLIKKYGTNSFSTLLLYDDITTFPLTSTDGFVGYRNSRKMLVVVGEPVCAPEKYRAAAEEFIEFCKRNGKQFIFICCSETFRNAVKDLDFSSIRIGEDFIFEVQSYAPKGDKTKMVRLARNHAQRAGAVVKEYNHVRGINPALEKTFNEITVRWLRKNNRFKAHIMGLNLFDHRELKRYFYAEVNDTPVAFITCLPIYGRNGILLEDAIRDPAAPYGVTELITLAIIEAFKKDGGNIVTSGISPKLDVSALSGPSRAVANIGMWFANRVFNLHKLYHFRKKFCTSMAEPSYLLKYPEGLGLLDLVRILTSF
jgi:phosphatidylglycerol lysyltransferase